MPSKFEVNNNYSAISPCQSDAVWLFRVIKRTEKTVTLLDENNEEIVKRVALDLDHNEFVRPLGDYSMSPVLRSSRLEK